MRSKQLGKLRQTNTVETINSILVTFSCEEFCTLRRPAKRERKRKGVREEKQEQDELLFVEVL